MATVATADLDTPGRGSAGDEAGRLPEPLARVLCVDDEPAMLALLARSLGARFEVVTSDDPVAALALVQHGSFSVVISDMKMPRMDGLQFLERVRILAPTSTRLALTACLERQLPPEVAFGILTKPCPLLLLQETVMAAAQCHAILRNATLAESQAAAPRVSGAVPVYVPPPRPAESGLRQLAPELAPASRPAARPSQRSMPVARPLRLALALLGQEVELLPRATLLGSSMDCDIVIKDPRVAPRHVRFFNSWRGVTVQDVSGRGDVRHNAARLAGVQFIRAGDRISLGPIDALVSPVGLSEPPP